MKRNTNSSYNGWYSKNTKKRILDLINKSEIELTPKEISVKTGLNHNTVKYYVRILLKENKIIQPYKGAYCSKITHGMIFVPLRVHNVILSSNALWLDFSDDVVEWVGDVKVRVQFGLVRRKITGRISCDSGMSKDTLFFAIHRFLDIVKERTGRVLDNFVVKTFEANRDYSGVRIDGLVKCYTLKGLFGVIERIYQKDDKVRHEFKVDNEMSLESFQSLISGGISTYNFQQAIFMLIQNNNRLIETIKFQNEKINQLYRLMEGIFKKYVKGEE